MNLSRAKAVLIAAFLILNLFLIYQIVVDERMDNPVFFGSKEEVSRLETALQQANLSLDVPLPRGGMHVAYLVVMPWQPVSENVVTLLWEGLVNNEEERENFSPADMLITGNHEDNISEWRFGDYELLLCKEGSFQLNNVFHDLEPQQIESAAEEFIKRVSFLQDFVYDYVKVGEAETILNYGQNYEGFPLYAGYLQVKCNAEPGCEIYLYRLEPLGFGEQEREVIPPSTALWRFLDVYSETEHNEILPTTIIEFSLGYYSEEYDAERWEIPPVWRIRLLNGEVYYINAFTGYLEN